MFKDGTKMFYGSSFRCDSRFRGLHIISQAQVEKIYVRDLMRHRVLVERSTVIDRFDVETDHEDSYPVTASIRHLKSGKVVNVRAKYLIGAEGAASGIRKQLRIPFDGTTTDIHWGIMDCKFETDYPYITTFGYVNRPDQYFEHRLTTFRRVFMNTEHGGCIIVPREDGYTRYDLAILRTVYFGYLTLHLEFTRSSVPNVSRSLRRIAASQVVESMLIPSPRRKSLNKLTKSSRPIRSNLLRL